MRRATSCATAAWRRRRWPRRWPRPPARSRTGRGAAAAPRLDRRRPRPGLLRRADRNGPPDRPVRRRHDQPGIMLAGGMVEVFLGVQARANRWNRSPSHSPPPTSQPRPPRPHPGCRVATTGRDKPYERNGEHRRSADRAQYAVGAGPYRATVTELGAGLRELLYDDQPLIAGYQPGELPRGGEAPAAGTLAEPDRRRAVHFGGGERPGPGRREAVPLPRPRLGRLHLPRPRRRSG